ncbi:MAG: hypothetical protein HFG77_16740 [Hungatella sp.]|nr:hypothetical protein [Hungatella sp.]
MVTFELDYRDSRMVKMDYKDIQFYDKVSLIDIICSVFYDDRVRFIVSDNICKNYNMDCKFDLICLLDVSDEIISALIKKEKFDIEFYEQGREYIFFFNIEEDTVTVDIWPEYDEDRKRRCEVAYNDIKEMFLSFYQSLFQYVEKCIENIDENVVFCEWKRKLNELKLL